MFVENEQTQRIENILNISNVIVDAKQKKRREKDTFVNISNVIVNTKLEKRREKDTFVNISNVIVNAKQKKRREKDTFVYGLKNITNYPCLNKEISYYLDFMTEYGIDSQEAPIRFATAEVYLRHAKLFIGWYIMNNNLHDKLDLSIKDIFLTKDKESAEPVVKFIQWLRYERKASISYQANILRGLCKLIKFRFSSESLSRDHTISSKSYEDIPLVREIRKQHTLAERKRKLAPRESDEKKKWISWGEYLDVINKVKIDTENILKKYEKPEVKSSLKGHAAWCMQKYLILAFFSQIPDRQRTYRELDIETTFIREEKQWIIKHGPDDYKTGKAYGDRPPLVLPESLTSVIDNFIAEWRPHLKPSSSKLFVQKTTGEQLTSDSIYQIIERSCFKYTNKRTNPHLLRDMVVTHVRDTEASEKELEALALYMGHSISMQRNSYDRRTISQKVQPAVNLLQSISKSK